VGLEGNLNTIKASNEINVDDKITLNYWTFIKAEFSEPTLAERAEPLQLVSEGGKTPDEVAPGAVVHAVAKAIVTIEVLTDLI
jgi:hypothetical protein